MARGAPASRLIVSRYVPARSGYAAAQAASLLQDAKKASRAAATLIDHAGSIGSGG